MNSTAAPSGPPRQAKPWWQQPTALALAAAAVIVVFYWLREHWGHVLGLWPYVVLLACPLMHLLHGHGRHEHPHRPVDPSASERESPHGP